MLGISGAPISKAKFIIGKNLEVSASEVTLLAGVVDETEPRVVDEFKGFEGVGSCEVLGKVIAIPNTPESMEFSDTSDVHR